MLCDCQKMIDISDGSWYDKDRNMSAILRKGDGYGIGTGKHRCTRGTNKIK